MDREVILTEEGFRKLTEEIEFLSTIKRREVAARIKEAREFGDISENSEYDAAKNEQAQLEYRIQSLEQKLRNARVVDTEHVSTEAVSIGARVTLKDLSRAQGHAGVLDRRLGRGRPAQPPPLQREPGRQGAARQAEGRQGDHPGAARRPPVPDRQDPGGGVDS